MELWQLRQRQSLPLEAKIVLSQIRIRQWYEAWGGNIDCREHVYMGGEP